MKFLLDNNLPPPLARALNELSKREGHSVVHLSEKFSPSTPDIEWVKALKAEGNWVVVSQDQFKKSDLEKHAFRKAGLTVFCLAKHWSKATYWAERLFASPGNTVGDLSKSNDYVKAVTVVPATSSIDTGQSINRLYQTSDSI